jgi:hypothetical protein
MSSYSVLDVASTVRVREHAKHGNNYKDIGCGRALRQILFSLLLLLHSELFLQTTSAPHVLCLPYSPALKMEAETPQKYQ